MCRQNTTNKLRTRRQYAGPRAKAAASDQQATAAKAASIQFSVLVLQLLNGSTASFSTSHQSPRRPWIRLMMMMTTAITSRRWISPPPMWPMKPRSQSTTRITIIVQSMVFLSIELTCIATQRGDAIKQKLWNTTKSGSSRIDDI